MSSFIKRVWEHRFSPNNALKAMTDREDAARLFYAQKFVHGCPACCEPARHFFV